MYVHPAVLAGPSRVGGREPHLGGENLGDARATGVFASAPAFICSRVAPSGKAGRGALRRVGRFFQRRSRAGIHKE